MAPKSKQEKKYYDENGGLIFVRNWPSLARWVSILPAAIIMWFVTRFLFLGTVINMLEKESTLLALYTAAVVAGLPCLVAVDTAAAMAPAKRVLVSIVMSIFIVIINVFMYYIFFVIVLDQSVEYLPLKTHIIVSLIISLISVLLCLYMAISMVKERQVKAGQAVKSTIVQ